jgi:non-canonical (house-cleaning) NTP pyrophosphatase
VGYAEGKQGAWNRLRSASDHVLGVEGEADAFYVVAIEDYIQELSEGEWWDIAFVVVMRRTRQREGAHAESLSLAIRFPTAAVVEARRRGFDAVTAGDVLAEQTGCSRKDPHGSLTGGLFPRGRLLEGAIAAALAQLLEQDRDDGAERGCNRIEQTQL